MVSFKVFFLYYNFVGDDFMSYGKDIDYKLIGSRIQKRRKAIGLSQMQLSEKIGISNTYLSYIETGKKIPAMDVWLALCDALNVSCDFLLRGAVYSDIDDQLIKNISLCTVEDKRILSKMAEFFIDKYQSDE